MTQKTKTTTKRTTTKTKAVAAKTQTVAAKKAPVKKAPAKTAKKVAVKKAAPQKKVTTAAPEVVTVQTPCPSTFNDVRNAILIVSLLFNLFILIAWIILQVTTQYDAEVARFLFVR